MLSYTSVSNKQQTIVLVNLIQRVKHNSTKTVICCLSEIQIELRALYIQSLNCQPCDSGGFVQALETLCQQPFLGLVQ